MSDTYNKLSCSAAFFSKKPDNIDTVTVEQQYLLVDSFAAFSKIHVHQ